MGQCGLTRSFSVSSSAARSHSCQHGICEQLALALMVVRIGIRGVLLKQICVGAWCHEAQLSGNSLPAACFAGSPRSRSPF